MSIARLGALLICSAIMSGARSEGPACPSASEEGRAGLCIYSIGATPAWSSLNVVVNGSVQGKLTRKQRYVFLSLEPGNHIVGLDAGRRPQVRRKLALAAGRTVYMRYDYAFESKTGFFDVSNHRQTHLLEVGDVDASSELAALVGSQAAGARK